MNDLIWCSSCGTEVSLARAVAELPCPCCGSKNYFVVATEAEQDALLSLCERMQRIGCWDVALAALSRARDQGYISAADYNLSSRALAWHKECAEVAVSLVSSAGAALTVGELESLLLKEYDEYTVGWTLSEYAGLRRVPFDDTCIVEVSDGK